MKDDLHKKPGDHIKGQPEDKLDRKQAAKGQRLTSVSNITGGITDEEFADEFLAYPADPNTKWAKYQFNFLGAELEKVNSAKNIRDELKK